MNVPKRMSAVQTPIIPVIGELIRENPGTISLGQGVVNYGPPRRAVDAIDSFLADPANHRYRLVQGIPELLDLISIKSALENGIEIGGDRRIVVTAGSNMGFMNTVLAITDPGDEIILLTPYYFNHEMAITIAGARPVSVPTDEEYQPDVEAIELAITDRTRAVVTISPNNPTGAVYDETTLTRINDLCRRRGVFHINDEAYEYFTYEDAVHYSPASSSTATGHTISLFSMSKSYGFASWRIGWMIVPVSLYESVRKIQDTNLICPPVISQWAAVGALTDGSDYCTARVEHLEGTRRSIMERFSRIPGIATVRNTKGAFYLFVEVHTGTEDVEIVRRLIREHRVAAIPGSAFGVSEGCYLRVAYGALDEQGVIEGVERLVTGLKRIVGR